MPTTSSGSQLLVPTGFYQTSQKVNATNNEMQFAWDGNGTSYQFVVGSGPGAADVFSTEVVGNTYRWVTTQKAGSYYARLAAKRGDTTSAFSTEVSLFVVDVRNVIDAMYFHGGPMSDTPDNARNNPVTSVWADGTRVNVLVSTEATETARANAQTFTDLYASLMGGAVTASISMTGDAMHDKDYRTFPEFTVGIRVQAGYCGGALGCVLVGAGPAPGGPNKAMVTLESGSGLYLSATAHELAHAYGISHVVTPVAGRPELRFMMSPVNASEQMTDTEKLAITLVRASLLRPGWTRSQALSAGLVNPY
ncbi:MAG: hypothetical protein WCQ64_06910 [Acidobacteriota bacterium]